MAACGLLQVAFRKGPIPSVKVVILDEFEAQIAVYNSFNIPPHLISRPALRLFRTEAHRAWAAATATA